MKIVRGTWLMIALGMLASRAAASDWYVDAQAGSNANSGTLPSSAWQTLTHALATIPPGGAPHTIHVAPGIYSPATGEQYPLVMRSGFRIVGTYGSSSTFLEGASGELVFCASVILGPTPPIGPGTALEGLTLRNSGTGVVLKADWNSVALAIRDVRISGVAGTGLLVQAGGSLGFRHAKATLERVEISGCGVGIDLLAHAGSNACDAGALARANLTDCTISSCASHGVKAATSGAGDNVAELSVQRSRIVGNGGHGVFASDRGTRIQGADVLVAGNTGGGIAGGTLTPAYCFSPPSGTFYSLTGCTVAHNGGAGLSVNGSSPSSVSLVGCILYGNADDLQAQATALGCDSGDGDLLGQPGCIAADPLFVSPATGDFRLAFGSPCADTGPPSSGLDLSGAMRPIDGDLDTLEQADMGALELAPLDFSGTPALGQTIRFEFWGASGAMATLRFSRQPLAAPQLTPFGELDLSPMNSLLGVFPAGPVTPGSYQRTIPNHPALFGRTFSFQARTTSPIAPSGAAWTNAVSFVVVI